MPNWLPNFTYALRRLRKSPGVTAAGVLSIGLGIAANATIFSMVSKFLLRDLPVADPVTLMALHTTHRGECCNNFTWPLFTDLRQQARSFSGITAYYDLMPASIGGSGEPERVWGQPVTSNYFDVAQPGMTLGRGFLVAEEHSPVIVLGNRLWQRRFASNPGVIGIAIKLSGRSFTVVGVTAPAFRGLDIVLHSEFWIPLGNIDDLLPKTANFTSRNYHWLAVAGRLEPGKTAAEASAELAVIAARQARAWPDAEKDGGFRFEQAGGVPAGMQATVKLFFAALMLVALLVLGIACANVMNLVLAQAASRQKDAAIRLALGAARGQLLRQTIAETMMISFGGTLAGLLLARWSTDGLSSFHIPAPVPLDLALAVDWRVVSFSFALSVIAGLAFAFVSTRAAGSAVLSDAMKGKDVLAHPGRKWTLRNVLVVSQIAMSLVLLCGTGLFLRSLRNAAGVDIGFRSSGITIMGLDPQVHGYSPERTRQLLSQLQQRVSEMPEVTSAAITDVAPLSGGHRSDGFTAQGRTALADMYMASPGYFETLGIRRLAGRDFARESAAAPNVAIVNETFARVVFKGQSPIGQTIQGPGARYQIIGLVKDIQSRSPGEEPRPVLYRSLEQSVGTEASMMGYTLVIYSKANLGSVAAQARQQIHALDPTLAIFNSQTMEEHLQDALFLPRLAGTLFGVFGITGLLLAAVGLYGVMSYVVSGRTREIGIRVALGATSGRVQQLIVQQGMALTVIAIIPGICIALALGKFAGSLLYGVSPNDPVTFISVPIFLGAIALLACWIPSRRAARMNPLTALRQE